MMKDIKLDCKLGDNVLLKMRISGRWPTTKVCYWAPVKQFGSCTTATETRVRQMTECQDSISIMQMCHW